MFTVIMSLLIKLQYLVVMLVSSFLSGICLFWGFNHLFLEAQGIGHESYLKFFFLGFFAGSVGLGFAYSVMKEFREFPSFKELVKYHDCQKLEKREIKEKRIQKKLEEQLKAKELEAKKKQERIDSYNRSINEIFYLLKVMFEFLLPIIIVCLALAFILGGFDSGTAYKIPIGYE